MNSASRLILSTSPPAQTGGKPPGLPALRCRKRLPCRGLRYRPVVKELDTETGLYYYGARYLDPKTSRWLSGDPAMGEYIPSAPVNDEARKRNGNLPGMGGVFNHVNLHAYHYAGNNPVKYTDPDGTDHSDYEERKLPEQTKAETVKRWLDRAIAFINENAVTDEEKAVASRLSGMMNNRKINVVDLVARDSGNRGIVGIYNSINGTIEIDKNEAYNGGLESVIDTLAHEGYHAVQFDQGAQILYRRNFERYEDYINARTDRELPAYQFGRSMENKYLSQNNRPPLPEYSRGEIFTKLFLYYWGRVDNR